MVKNLKPKPPARRRTTQARSSRSRPCTATKWWEDQPLPPRRGRITMLMTREPEGWLIAAFQNTDIVAANGSGALTRPSTSDLPAR
jgi:hypothetical protein